MSNPNRSAVVQVVLYDPVFKLIKMFVFTKTAIVLKLKFKYVLDDLEYPLFYFLQSPCNNISELYSREYLHIIMVCFLRGR